MTSRLHTAIAMALLVGALPAAAQITPPNLRKPIEVAKKAADATSAQIQSSQRVSGEVKQGGMLPAEAAQSGAKGTPSTPQNAAATKAAEDQKLAEQKAAAVDSASRRGSATQSGGKGTVFFFREEYSYADEGRRDPFVSLMTTGELRPILADLELIGVLYDQSQPARSLAVLVDGTSNETYRVKAGNVIGRMKVLKVGERDITFSLDEFGFSRQETLPLDMTSRKAGAAPGRRPQ